MQFSEWCNSGYTPRSIIAASSRTVNWFTEEVEQPEGKAKYTLYRTPGLSVFCDTLLAATLPSAEIRGVFGLNGHTYWVVGSHAIEVFSDGTFIDYSATSGVVIPGSGPVTMAGNPAQIMISGGGNGYILAAATLVQIVDPGFPTGSAGPCTFQDGYFIVLIAESQQFQISALNDGLTWDAADVSSEESRPDFGVACLSDHEELWIAGTQTIQIFTDTGATFPFEANVSAVIQQGIVAANTFVSLDNSVFFLGGDDRGHGVVWRVNGYVPRRISNHAVENRIQGYGDLSNAIAWTFEMNGHMFLRLSFPSANSGRGATEQLDVATGQWVETPYWNVLGYEEEHRCRTAVFAFDKILAGDRSNGKIYELSMANLDDNGDIIRRVRRAPHIVKERNNIVYHQIRFDENVGIGIGGSDETARGYDPQYSLKWSDNGGAGNWSNERFIKLGKQGRFGLLSQTSNLGMGRDRVFERVDTSPVDLAIADCYFDATVLQS